MKIGVVAYLSEYMTYLFLCFTLEVAKQIRSYWKITFYEILHVNYCYKLEQDL